MVGLGVLIGAWVAARYVEEHTASPATTTYRLATRLVIAGVIGARITWVLSHTEPDRLARSTSIAVWKGGLQFSGGFIAAVIVGFPTFRKWTPLDALVEPRRLRVRPDDRPRVSAASAAPRSASTSAARVSLLLAVRYDGGSVREETLGPTPLRSGSDVPQHRDLRAAVPAACSSGSSRCSIRRKPAPGTVIGIFCLYYGVARGLSDFLRVNDKTVARPHRRAVDVRRAHPDRHLDPHSAAIAASDHRRPTSTAATASREPIRAKRVESVEPVRGSGGAGFGDDADDGGDRSCRRPRRGRARPRAAGWP